MGTRYALRSIQARGFCGIGAEPLLLELDRPLTLLVGPNGAGKTTLLTAVEWALFGDCDHAGTYKIHEYGRGQEKQRAYINKNCDAAAVRLTFSDGSNTVIWSRRRNRSNPNHDEVTCSLNGNAENPDPQALFGLTPEMYARVVSLNQLAVQRLVAFEDSERNKALDLLFGLERLNVLSEGVSRARRTLGTKLSGFEGRIRHLHDHVRSQVKVRFDRRRDARSRALRTQVPREGLNLAWALSTARRTAEPLKLPHPSDGAGIRELAAFAAEAFHALQDYRHSLPNDAVLHRLNSVRDKVSQARGDWQRRLDYYDGRDKALAKFEKQYGDGETLAQSAKEVQQRVREARDRLSQAQAHAAVLSQARTWFERCAHAPDQETGCPVCARPIAALELGKAIDAALTWYEDSDAGLQKLMADVQAAETQRGQAEKRVGEHRDLVRALNEARDGVKASQATLVREITALPGSWTGSPTHEEQPVQNEIRALLAMIKTLESDRAWSGETFAELDQGLRTLLQTINEAAELVRDQANREAERLKELREGITQVEELCRFLQADAELAELDDLVRAEELRAALNCLAELSHSRAVVDTVYTALDSVVGIMAEERVARIEPALVGWFERLSAHARLKSAQIRVQTSRAGGSLRCTYRVRAASADGDWVAPPGPMLSGGYQNLLAIAAVCALADPQVSSHRLELLLLDEPTQSLDPDHARRLAEALGGLTLPVHMVITTTNPAFAAQLVQTAGPARVRRLKLQTWQADTGTQFGEVIAND
jgi:DNA repair exonuclease SbcCD ATPase subunit